MPLFELDLEKQFQAEVWSNIYTIQAADLGAAAVIAADIADLELTITQPTVMQTKGRVSTIAEDSYNFVTVPFNRMGTRTGQIGANMLPLYVTARVDFAAGSGLPSRKYLRGVLATQDVDTFDTLDATVTGQLETYGDGLVALAGFVDVDNEALTNATVYPKTQMRQLRRKSPKKTPTP